jgi:ribonuclease R
VTRKPKPQTGLPTRQQVLDFIASSADPVGKREIARAFGLKGQEKIALKALLRDMAEEGLIDGNRSAFHRMGGVPKVTVLRVVDTDDGEAVAVPDSWTPDDATPPPRLRVREKGRSALRKGDRVLARTEETGSGWIAHPMKKLPAMADQVMGVVEIDRSGKGWLAPIDKRERNAAPIADLGGAEAGQLVLAEPAGKSPRSGVKVTSVLGDPLAPKAFSLIAIHKHGIPFAFSAETLEEGVVAARLPLSVERREDLRHLPIVAIDPSDARDHDDAIWAEPDGENGYHAIVAIADVSFYVRPGGALDREARKRGNSVYFPDQVVPMLPEALSADACSLKAGTDKAVLAARMEVDRDGEIIGASFHRARVRIAANLAYEEAQAIIDGRADNALKAPVLEPLWACWAALSKARARRGPLELDLPEKRVILDAEGRVKGIALRERFDAHRLIEDMMIAANVAAAKALEAKKAPVMYRDHEAPSREKLVSLKDYLGTMGISFALGQVVKPATFNQITKKAEGRPDATEISEAVLRSQTQAYYAPRNEGHFGLALGSYAHFTSPIRRYSDVLVHRALVGAYRLGAGGLPDGAEQRFAAIGEHISFTERRAMAAERETLDRYIARHLAAHVGSIVRARISGVQAFGLFATVDGIGGDGLLPVSALGAERFHFDAAARSLEGADSGTAYHVGQMLDLRLEDADPATGALRFALADRDTAPERGNRPRQPRRVPARRGVPPGVRRGRSR